VRHGHESGELTLGGRRIQVERPRVRSAGSESEVALRTYQHFADCDPFSRHLLEQLLASVSARRFLRTQELVGAEVEAVARSTSRSAVSREFIARTRENLLSLMSRHLDDVRLAVLMLDGIELKGRCCMVALGISTDGVKLPLGLWGHNSFSSHALDNTAASSIGRNRRGASRGLIGRTSVPPSTDHKVRNSLNGSSTRRSRCMPE
jgi:putative transposase